ncbi:hypothetical protein [Streptomyces sp. NPDC056883]
MPVSGDPVEAREASGPIAGKVPLPVIQARSGHESITATVDR